MKRTVFLAIALILFFSLTSAASAKVKLKFYYPVGVAGPLVKVINGMVGAAHFDVYGERFA